MIEIDHPKVHAVGGSSVAIAGSDHDVPLD